MKFDCCFYCGYKTSLEEAFDRSLAAFEVRPQWERRPTRARARARDLRNFWQAVAETSRDRRLPIVV